MKKRKTVIVLVALLCVVCLALVFFVTQMSRSGIKEEKLKVTILKTGKSDAIVLESAGHAMMIDTAEIDDTEKVVAFLKEQGIHTLDYVIITHFDKDHLGASARIVEDFNVGQVLIPNYEGTIDEYADFMEAMAAALVTPQRVEAIMDLPFGETNIHIEPPINYDVNVVSEAVEDYDNTLSLMTTVTCGNQRLLFTGDADRRRIREWLDNGEVAQCDFLKVPHHGKFNTGMEPLLEAIAPKYAAITCSKKNPADTSTIELLQKYGIETYQTRDGQITLVTDGETLEFRLN